MRSRPKEERTMSSLHHHTPHHDTPTAAWPSDGVVTARLAQAAATRIAAAHNDRAKRLYNLSEAVAQREGDLARAQRAPGGARNPALLQIQGRLHRARLELAELQGAH
jgi:hypothetical protein